MKKLTYLMYSLKWFAVHMRNKIKGNRWNCKGKRYAGRELMPNQKGNDFIAEGIKSGKPFMAARFGSVELLTVSNCYAIDLGIKKEIHESNLRDMTNNAGFFPKDAEKVKKFSDLMLECMPKVDLLGVWYNDHEDYFIKHKMPNTKITYIRGLDAYLAENPWTKHLEGKKVVVVHPFEKSIMSQYTNNREKLFGGKEVLPEFNLRVVKAVVTLAGETDERFKDWFEALDYMYNEVMKEDFDVAILGCGAYGFPLAAKIKDAGKQAIHLGGPTQILFGIKGQRWEDRPEGKFFNEYWVRPSAEETPKASNKVEKGCYW